MNNHLFIGLGGQGGKTLSELRKVIESRKADVQELNRLANLEYLYIDSSTDVWNEAKNWTHFGKSIKLDDNCFLNLSDAGHINVQQLATQPNVAPWIGDYINVSNFLKGTTDNNGANQRRRLGRLLFAQNIPKIRKALFDDKIEPMRTKRTGCAIHIFASLAGGTGSGGIVDLVTMLREKYNDGATDNGFPIFLYIYVTAGDFESAKVGYFHENQAAALRDLNALACEQYHPNMLDDAAEGIRYKRSQPFTQIAISSESNGPLTLGISQQHQIVAEAAFERIFCYKKGTLTPAQQRAVTGEDIIAAYPAEPTNRPDRSYRFGSLGMRRWEVPIDKVRELLAHDLLVSSLNMLLYQNWNGTIGAGNQKVRANIQGYSQTLEEVLLAVDEVRITQSELPPLIEKLNADINRFHDGKRREGFKNIDLSDYETLLRKRYNEHLDDRGVEVVFREFETQRSNSRVKLKSRVHGIIKSAWVRLSNPLGLMYVSDLLNDVRLLLSKEIAEAYQPTEPDKSIENRMRLRKIEWNKLTFLSRPFKQDQLARAHQADLLSLFRQDLRQSAGREDAKRLDEVSRDLLQMVTDSQQAAKFLEAKRDTAKTKSDTIEKDLSLLSNEDAGHQQGSLANKAEFSFSELTSYIEEQRLERDELHYTCDEIISKAIYTVLGDEWLTKLGNHTQREGAQVEQITESIIFSRATLIHDAIVERTPHREPVLSGNILDILQNRYIADNGVFEENLRSFINSAASSISLKSTEPQPRAMRGDGGMPGMPRQVLVIGIPSAHPFGRDLRTLVDRLRPPGDTTLWSIYDHGDPTQIRMLTMTYWMAARFAGVVHDLEARYNDAIAKDITGERKYFTNIDESGERPAILLPTPQEAKSQMRAALWLGSRMKAPGTDQFLIQETKETGVVLVEIYNQNIIPRALNKSLNDLNFNADIATASRVIAVVENALAHRCDAIDTDLRNEITLEEGRKALNGIAGIEYGAWVKDRENLLKFLDKPRVK